MPMYQALKIIITNAIQTKLTLRNQVQDIFKKKKNSEKVGFLFNQGT